MLSLSHGAEWAGPESEEYCDAPAGEKKMYFRKTQQIVILPRKNSCVTHPWGYGTVQQPAASLAFGAFLHRHTENPALKVSASARLQCCTCPGRAAAARSNAETTEAGYLLLPLPFGRYRDSEHATKQDFFLKLFFLNCYRLCIVSCYFSLSLTLLGFLLADKQVLGVSLLTCRVTTDICNNTPIAWMSTKDCFWHLIFWICC